MHAKYSRSAAMKMPIPLPSEPKGTRSLTKTVSGGEPGRATARVAANPAAWGQHGRPTSSTKNEKARVPTLRENARSGQVLVRTREDKTESIDYFKGGMSGVLKLEAGKVAAENGKVKVFLFLLVDRRSCR
jgi:hypothetical protein